MIRKTYWIFCDHCGDQYKYNRDSLSEIRKHARVGGWKYSKFTGDICPKCQKLELEEYKGMVAIVDIRP